MSNAGDALRRDNRIDRIRFHPVHPVNPVKFSDEKRNEPQMNAKLYESFIKTRGMLRIPQHCVNRSFGL